MNLPTVRVIASNFVHITMGDLKMWFSYGTLIAFHRTKLIISENIWTKTTGKHLNQINSNKTIRVPYQIFTNEWHKSLDMV